MAYSKWKRDAVSFSLVDEVTSDPVATIEVITPGGTMTIMGEPYPIGKILVVERIHISSRGIGPNDIGIRNLRLIADVIMEAMGYDVIRLEGAIRTTGANPGRRPRPIRFARNRRDPAGI
jgi:hypothetical protein